MRPEDTPLSGRRADRRDVVDPPGAREQRGELEAHGGHVGREQREREAARARLKGTLPVRVMIAEVYEACRLDALCIPIGLLAAFAAAAALLVSRSATATRDGPAGEEIPLAARIVAVCDSVNAMTTTRSHRKALPVSHAVAELHRCSGTQFDPVVVDALLAVIGDPGWELTVRPAQSSEP